MNCRELRAPFSDNYCRDWLLYHGGIFAAGALLLVIGVLAAPPLIWIGIAAMIVGPMAGLANYLCDRDFKRHR